MMTTTVTTTTTNDHTPAPPQHPRPLKKPTRAPKHVFTRTQTNDTHNAHSKNTNTSGGTFTVSACVADGAGTAVCTIGLVVFQGVCATPKLLWTASQTKNYKVYTASVTGVINAPVVDSTRDALAAKLSSLADSSGVVGYISSLDV